MTNPKNKLPEGTVRFRNCGRGGITQKKVDGKWITVYKDRSEYKVPENSPIGKSGPRPELRELIFKNTSLALDITTLAVVSIT